jgi:hypothetical protein
MAFLLTVDGVIAAWGKSRPAAEFFEQILAEVLHWGSLIGTLTLPFYVFGLVYKRTNKQWMAWTACMIVFSVAGFVSTYLTSLIPGIGWRIDRLTGSDY